jgi:hypothetical protein
MADNPQKWSAYTAAKTALFAATDLKNLTTGSGKLSTASAINNAAGDQLADLELLIDLATAAAAGGYIAIWFIKALDASNYGSGADAVFPARPPDVIIPVRSTTDDSQVVTIAGVLWPQGLFKVLFQNNSGQTTTNTDSLTQVYFRSYNNNIVTP